MRAVSPAPSQVGSEAGIIHRTVPWGHSCVTLLAGMRVAWLETAGRLPGGLVLRAGVQELGSLGVCDLF